MVLGAAQFFVGDALLLELLEFLEDQTRPPWRADSMEVPA